jgi:hypothetical protein
MAGSLNLISVADMTTAWEAAAALVDQDSASLVVFVDLPDEVLPPGAPHKDFRILGSPDQPCRDARLTEALKPWHDHAVVVELDRLSATSVTWLVGACAQGVATATIIMVGTDPDANRRRLIGACGKHGRPGIATLLGQAERIGHTDV